MSDGDVLEREHEDAREAREQRSMERTAKELVAAAVKCLCGRIAVARLTASFAVKDCCGPCCGLLLQTAAQTLPKEETFKLAPLHEGRHARDVAIAYGIADGT